MIFDKKNITEEVVRSDILNILIYTIKLNNGLLDFIPTRLETAASASIALLEKFSIGTDSKIYERIAEYSILDYIYNGEIDSNYKYSQVNRIKWEDAIESV